MMPGTGPRGAHDEVLLAGIRMTRHGAAELVSGALPCERDKQRTAVTRIHIGMPWTLGLPVLARAAHDHIRVSVAIYVARARHMIAKVLDRIRSAKLVQHTPVPAGVDARDARPGRSTRHHVRDAVTVGIARGLHTGAELVARCTIRAPQQPASGGRIHIDAACTRATGAVGGRGNDHIAQAVTVHVTDVAGDPAELVVRCLAAPFADDFHRLDKWLLEVLRLRLQRGEAGVRLERGKVLIYVDPSHVVTARGARTFEPLESARGIVLGCVCGTQVIEDLG